MSTFDESLFDRYEDGYDFDGVVCERCDMDGLHWEDRGKGFRLYEETGLLHTCHKPSSNDFEDLT